MNYLDINSLDNSFEINNVIFNSPNPVNFEYEYKIFTYDENNEIINKEENFNNQIIKNRKQEKIEY